VLNESGELEALREEIVELKSRPARDHGGLATFNREAVVSCLKTVSENESIYSDN
jgi:chromosome segregation ATPase